MQRQQHRGRRAFSLVETLVAVALIALVSAVMVPAIGNLTRLDLRRGTRQLASNVRLAFDEAALTGQTYRITFRLPRPPGAPKPSKEEAALPAIAIEAADGGLAFSGRDGALRMAQAAALDANDDGLTSFDSYFAGTLGAGQAVPPAIESSASADAALGPKGASGETLQAMFGINKLAKRGNKENFSPVGEVTLPAGITVYAVWLSGMLAAETHGDVSLLFFPAGYTQDAILYVTDESGHPMSLAIQALTGQSAIIEGAMSTDDFEVDA